MRDQAYRRDLRRALEKLVTVKRIVVNKGHLVVTVVMPDRTEKEFVSSGSPADHQHAINNTVRTLKRYLKKGHY